MDALPSFFANTISLLSVSCFVKVLATLSIFRFALGLRGIGFGIVTLLFSLSVTWVTMEPHINNVGGLALFTKSNTLSAASFEKEFRPFLESNIDVDVAARLKAFSAHQGEGEEQEVSFSVLLCSFLISELRDAFLLGFLFVVPFLVIDLLVANALMVLGITTLETFTVSFPLKILLFFSVDGWGVLTTRLLQGYGG